MHELTLYFDKTLPYLLYPQETPFSLAKLKPCKIYSCEYLLRLLVKLPALIKEECKPFCLKMSDLVRYLTKHKFAFFKQNYKSDESVVSSNASSLEGKKTSLEGKRKSMDKGKKSRKKIKMTKITSYLKPIKE